MKTPPQKQPHKKTETGKQANPTTTANKTTPTPHKKQASKTSGKTRYTGLDGLRAIAVLLVLIYHLFPGAAPGGLAGVDVFFVISGFLITSLLLREKQKTGGICLNSFWRRRARRLLPALTLCLTACAALATIVGGDPQVRIGGQLLSAELFFSNWYLIFSGSDYFAHQTPELFRNTWSLAIEEQFYLVLPLLLVCTWTFFAFARRLQKHRNTSAAAAAERTSSIGSRNDTGSSSNAGGGRSTGDGISTSGKIFATLSFTALAFLSVWLYLYAPYTPARAYFGSDSHAFGLLAGVALAFACFTAKPQLPFSAAAPATPVSPATPATPAVSIFPAKATAPRTSANNLFATFVAGIGITALIALSTIDYTVFPAQLPLASLAALVTVWAVTRPGSLAGRLLDARPLQWIGERSYALYLWHWPLLILFTGAGIPQPLDGIAALILSFTVAALSYRLVEQPVRRLGFRLAFDRLWRVGAKRFTAVFLTCATLGLLTFSAVATAPAMSRAEQAVLRGKEALAAAALERDRLESEIADAREQMQRRATIKPGVGARVQAIGDSVMLASAPELQQALPGIAIDADVSRGLHYGVHIAEQLAAESSLRDVLVVGLGTNGPISSVDLEKLVAIAAGRQIVVVNAYGERDWIPGVNEQLARFAAQNKNVALADWNSAIAPRAQELLAADLIHPGSEGGEIYARTVTDALERQQSFKEKRYRGPFGK